MKLCMSYISQLRTLADSKTGRLHSARKRYILRGIPTLGGFPLTKGSSSAVDRLERHNQVELHPVTCTSAACTFNTSIAIFYLGLYRPRQKAIEAINVTFISTERTRASVDTGFEILSQAVIG
ncbi:hypothetical protein VNI00_011190 [Paramarasmius palmivorus]|uniref:Uncharacterized protein n=1 Tax=Paramarasmius palmivorus TaxID=297713 RepID=A0AAW0CES0_9AGAR